MPLKQAVEGLGFDNKPLLLEFDDQAFREAGLSLEKTECRCDIYGLSKREWLLWLSAQFPKPIHLVEKDGKLVFTPAVNLMPEARDQRRSVETK